MGKNFDILSKQDISFYSSGLETVCAIPDTYAWQWFTDNGFGDRLVAWSGE